MEYMPVFLAFLSACIALKGNTWDASEVGIDKLTSNGKYALALIVFALIYSASTVYSAREKQFESERDNDRISKIIDYEVTKSIRSIIRPFRSLYMEYTAIGYIPDEDISLKILLEKNNLEKAQKICFELHPTIVISIPDSGNWHEIFRVGITSGINRLESLQVRYSDQMSSELLESIHNLIEKGYFSGYAWHKPTSMAGQKSDDESKSIPQCVFGQAIGAHKEYLTMIGKVYEANKSNIYQR